MYYYTDNENLRFLSCIKARPDNIPKIDNSFQFEVSKVEKIWKEWNETDFNNIKEL